jgi:cytochrome c oxidase subunit 2
MAVRRRNEGTSAAMQEYLPLVVLIAVFGWLAVRSQQLWSAQRYVGAAPEAMQVEVTGEQFAWYFRYPGEDAAFGQTKFSLISAGSGNPLGIDPVDEKGKDDIVTSQLVLPAGREVDLTLRSLDVIHGFSVPEMRLKQNAVPGQASHLHFTPTAPGEYAILCTQVCGAWDTTVCRRCYALLPADAFDDLAAQEARAAAMTSFYTRCHAVFSTIAHHRLRLSGLFPSWRWRSVR